MDEESVGEYTIEIKDILEKLKKSLEVFEKYWTIYEKVKLGVRLDLCV
jgi:hypothetical protein